MGHLSNIGVCSVSRARHVHYQHDGVYSRCIVKCVAAGEWDI